MVIADELFMDRAIQLAKWGDNRTKTNPLVGAVIVHNHRIIGEGWHRAFGGPHAEINALQAVSEKERRLIPSSSIYVTLEPCSFVGKSPSCARRLAKEKVKRVVVGAIDPNTKVNGLGCKILKDAEIQVDVGIRRDECERLLLPFSTQQQKHRPFIHLKWAQSYDGYLTEKNKSTLISHPYLKFITHQIRGACQGIMVGTETLLVDNPQLDNRYGTGENPTKIILDRKGRISSKNWKFLSSGGTTIGLGPNGNPMKKYYNEYIEVSRDISLREVMKLLYSKGIGTIMIEGGAQLLKSFIQEGLWDKATVIKSPKSLHTGIKAPSCNGKIVRQTPFVNHDILELVPGV